MHHTRTPAAPTAATVCTPPTCTGSAPALAAPASSGAGECSPCHQLFARACGLWRIHHKNPLIGWDYLPLSLVAYSEF